MKRINKIKIYFFKKNKIFPLVLLLTFSIFIFSGSVYAYQKRTVDVDLRNDFVVEPGRTEIFLNPGESTIKNITITNRINRNTTFRLTTEDFVGSDDQNTPVVLLGDEIGPYSLKDFIRPEINTFSLEPGEQITLNVRISVPEDSEPGGFYGALIISNVPPSESAEGEEGAAQGQTRIVSRIGSLFLVRVNGPVNESGHISDFKVIEEKPFYTQRPDGFEIYYKNEGSVHLVPYGEIRVKNIFNNEIAVLPVDAYATLPDSIRYRQVEWEDGFSIGRYKAELSLYKGYGDEYDTDSLVFWVIPWKVIVIALIVLFVLSSILYFIVTRFELKRKS